MLQISSVYNRFNHPNHRMELNLLSTSINNNKLNIYDSNEDNKISNKQPGHLSNEEIVKQNREVDEREDSIKPLLQSTQKSFLFSSASKLTKLDNYDKFKKYFNSQNRWRNRHSTLNYDKTYTNLHSTRINSLLKRDTKTRIVKQTRSNPSKQKSIGSNSKLRIVRRAQVKLNKTTKTSNRQFYLVLLNSKSNTFVSNSLFKSAGYTTTTKRINRIKLERIHSFIYSSEIKSSNRISLNKKNVSRTNEKLNSIRESEMSTDPTNVENTNLNRMSLNQTPSTSNRKMLKSKNLYNNTNTTEESRLSESTSSASSSTASSGFKSRSRPNLKYFNHKLNHYKRKRKQQAEQQVPQLAQPKSTFTALNAARNLIKLFSRNKPKKEETKTLKTVKSESETMPTLGSSIPLACSKNRLTIGGLAAYNELSAEKTTSSNQFKHIQITLDQSSSENNNNSSNSSSFGFTVIGYCPCQIAKVERDSIAQHAGLLVGDFLIKINGKNVSRATCDSIVKIIKNSSSQRFLKLDVYRKQARSKLDKQQRKPNRNISSSISSCPMRTSLATTASNTNTNTNSNSNNHVVVNSTENSNFNSINKLENRISSAPIINQHQTPKMLSSLSAYKNNQSVSNRKKTVIKKRSHKTSLAVKGNKQKSSAEPQHEEFYEYEKNNNNNDELVISPIPYLPPIKRNSSETDRDEYEEIEEYSEYEENEEDEDQEEEEEEDDSEIEIDLNNDKRLDEHGLLQTQLAQKKSSITDSDYKTQSSATENDAASVISSSLPKVVKQNKNLYLDDVDLAIEQDNYVDSDAHLSACEHLLNLEEKFIELMQKGVQQYSRPLRHCMMISSLQHHLLFQNIEKILAISEYQLNQLISQDDSTLLDMFNTIGKLYENKMRMSCEAFDIYLNGIDNSFGLLFDLINMNCSANPSIPNFSKFLYDSQEDIDMDLKTFLLLPLYYVGDIYVSLKSIREKTSANNSDFMCLTNLLNGLESYVKKSTHILNKYNNGQLKNPLRTVSSSSVSDEDYFNCNKNNSVCSSNKKSVLYTTQIQYRQSSHKWKRIKVVLLNDKLVLVSRRANIKKLLNSSMMNSTDNTKSATFKTINLASIVNINFNLSKELEFQVNYFKTNNKNLLHTVKLKVESLDEKLKWNKLFNRCLADLIDAKNENLI